MSETPLFLFRVGDVMLLCPAEQVEAVIAWQEPVPLPRVPDHLIGLVSYDQRALVLVDLARFLAIERPATPASRTLVVHAGDYRVGLPVDRAHGVVPIDTDTVKNGAHVVGGRLAEFTRAEAETGEGGLAALIDLSLLLEAARV